MFGTLPPGRVLRETGACAGARLSAIPKLDGQQFIRCVSVSIDVTLVVRGSGLFVIRRLAGNAFEKFGPSKSVCARRTVTGLHGAGKFEYLLGQVIDEVACLVDLTALEEVWLSGVLAHGRCERLQWRIPADRRSPTSRYPVR